MNNDIGLAVEGESIEALCAELDTAIPSLQRNSGHTIPKNCQSRFLADVIMGQAGIKHKFK
jgi:hypothetical protein